MAPPWSIQDTAHDDTVKSRCSVDAHATIVIIITLYCWFRLTVQWDDPGLEFAVVSLWGLFLCILYERLL